MQSRCLFPRFQATFSNVLGVTWTGRMKYCIFPLQLLPLTRFPPLSSSAYVPPSTWYFTSLCSIFKVRSKQVCLFSRQGELKDRAQQARAAELDLDNRNGALLKEEEIQFQEYASKVIAEAKAHERNPYPLIKAAREGPGGGRGPKLTASKGFDQVILFLMEPAFSCPITPMGQ